MKRRWKFLSELKEGDQVKLSSGEIAEVLIPPDNTRTSLVKVRISIDKLKVYDK